MSWTGYRRSESARGFWLAGPAYFGAGKTPALQAEGSKLPEAKAKAPLLSAFSTPKGLILSILYIPVPILRVAPSPAHPITRSPRKACFFLRFPLSFTHSLNSVPTEVTNG